MGSLNRGSSGCDKPGVTASGSTMAALGYRSQPSTGRFGLPGIAFGIDAFLLLAGFFRPPEDEAFFAFDAFFAMTFLPGYGGGISWISRLLT
jgi:hypothetical protein